MALEYVITSRFIRVRSNPVNPELGFCRTPDPHVAGPLDPDGSYVRFRDTGPLQLIPCYVRAKKLTLTVELEYGSSRSS